MSIPVPGRVAEALRRSTVLIVTGGSSRQGSGSGVVITGERVITNAHVVNGNSVQVESWEGKQLKASVVNMDSRRDLACLHVSGLPATPAELGDSDQVRPGLPVFAVGNPMGFTGAVSSGVVHRVGPAHPISGLPWIHADVRLAPGNSGGPLADFSGRVLGVNSMIVSGGIALAVPSRAIQSFLTRASQTRRIGVTLRPVRLRSGAMGLMVLEVARGGAAENASLLVGDILAGSAGVPFRSVDGLHEAIENAPNGLLRLDFYRAGQNVLRHVTLVLHGHRESSAA